MVAAFRYPAREIDQPKRLAELCGTFWSLVYSDEATLLGFLGGFGRLIRQADRNFYEAQQGLGRFASPLGHVELWRLFRFLESEILQSEASFPQYGEGFIHGSSSMLIFYGRAVTKPTYCMGLPTNIDSITAIHNRLSEPSISWLEGIDYLVDRDKKQLQLNVNPFDEPNSSVRTVYVGNEPVDRELSLWGQLVGMRTNLIREQHGYLWDIEGPISESYRRLVNAVADAAVEGSTLRIVKEILGAILDEPTVVEDGEIVENVWSQPDALVVVTNKRAYRCPAAASTDLVAGDVLGRGEYLSSTIRVFELNRGQMPPVPWIAVEPRFLGPGYRGSLLFTNEESDWAVTDDDGLVEVQFPIGGNDDDVARFWSDVAVQEAATRTLAQCLTGDESPAAVAFAGTVNPAEFIVEHVLRNNLFLIEATLEHRSRKSLPLHQLGWLREVLPPHVGLMISLSTVVGVAEFSLTTPVNGGPGVVVSSTPSFFIEGTAIYSLAEGSVQSRVSYGRELCV